MLNNPSDVAFFHVKGMNVYLTKHVEWLVIYCPLFIEIVEPIPKITKNTHHLPFIVIKDILSEALLRKIFRTVNVFKVRINIFQLSALSRILLLCTNPFTQMSTSVKKPLKQFLLQIGYWVLNSRCIGWSNLESFTFCFIVITFRSHNSTVPNCFPQYCDRIFTSSLRCHATVRYFQ